MNSIFVKNATYVIILAFISTAFAGCKTSSRVLDFTIVSSKNTDMRIPDQAEGERTTGVDEETFWFGFGSQPSIKEAIDRAIENAGGQYDALIDGVIELESKSLFINTKVKYTVEGTPVETAQITTMAKNAGMDLETFMATHNIKLHSETELVD